MADARREAVSESSRGRLALAPIAAFVLAVSMPLADAAPVSTSLDGRIA
jgi:hypothetical protein